jgi:hypothetical protein
MVLFDTVTNAIRQASWQSAYNPNPRQISFSVRFLLASHYWALLQYYY